jgi:hypothetical protein
MLSIGKMVAGAEDYYLGIVAQGKEEYYTGTGEAPGKWMGSGTEALGLRGEVAPDDLRAILAGVSPQDGSPLAAGEGARHGCRGSTSPSRPPSQSRCSSGSRIRPPRRWCVASTRTQSTKRSATSSAMPSEFAGVPAAKTPSAPRASWRPPSRTGPRERAMLVANTWAPRWSWSGDRPQLPEIEAGGALAGLIDRLGGDRAQREPAPAGVVGARHPLRRHRQQRGRESDLGRLMAPFA